MHQIPLSKSERIHLVEAVKDALYQFDFERADLILRTFDLDGLDLESSAWGYQPKVDIREQVIAASDDILLDIAAHLELDGYVGETRIVSSEADYLWKPDYLRIFVSHLASHKAFAADVVEELRKFGIDGFVAHTVIEPEQVWQTEIERALRSCDAFVGLLHQGFKDSIWTQQETGWALGREIPTIMIGLGESPVGFKAKAQALLANGATAKEVATQLILTLSNSRELGNAVAEKVVNSLQSADSYYGARDVALLLENMGSLPASILDRIELAYRENNQIYPDHIAAPIVKRILSRHGRELP
jgi:hypothetical protein